MKVHTYTLALYLCFLSGLSGCTTLDRTQYQDDPAPSTPCLAPADFNPSTVGLDSTHTYVDSDGLLAVDGVESGLAYGVLLMNSRCVMTWAPWYGAGAKWVRFDHNNPTHVAHTRRYYGSTD